MHFRCVLPRVQWDFFSLVVGKYSFVVPDYVILSKSCGWIVFWLFVKKYIFLSVHFVTTVGLVAPVSRYVSVGSWAVRDFSHASSRVSWGLLSIATHALFGA